jgi:hypothetical protein
MVHVHTWQVQGQVKSNYESPIMHSALCKEQQHIQKQNFFHDYGVAEAPPEFQAGWSDCMYFFLSFCSFCLLIWI